MHFARSSIVVGQMVPDKICERGVHFACFERQRIKLTLPEIDTRHIGASFGEHSLTVIDTNDLVTALSQPSRQESCSATQINDLRATRPSLRKNLCSQRANGKVLTNAVPLLGETVVSVTAFLTTPIKHSLQSRLIPAPLICIEVRLNRCLEQRR